MGYFLRADVEYLKMYIAFTMVYLFCLKDYFIHIKNLKQVLNQGLVLKKVYKVIKFNQKVLLKSYIDMNTELRKKCKK